jgi:hypothetical protein
VEGYERGRVGEVRGVGGWEAWEGGRVRDARGVGGWKEWEVGRRVGGWEYDCRNWRISILNFVEYNVSKKRWRSRTRRRTILRITRNIPITGTVDFENITQD